MGSEQFLSMFLFSFSRTCNKDSSRITRTQRSTSPSVFCILNKKDQTDKTISSISKAVKTSSENAVPVENSPSKSLEGCDSEEACFPEINLNAGSSSEEDDTTQQNKRDVLKITSLSRKEEPCLSTLKSPNDSQPEDYEEPEIVPCLEESGNNQSNRERSESRPQVVLSFEQEVMNEKKFLNDTPDTFDQNSTAKIPDQPFEVRTSWEGRAVQEIKNIADKSTEVLDLNDNNGTPIRIIDFFHYAKIIHFLLEFCPKW
ncbi:unnamed protein product [Leuciscus chuanchicus]